jgi:hypothetical protein
METLANDIRFSFRQMRRNPAFAFFIVATLAIGIGANTTIFSALNALLLRPLPFAHGEQLMHISAAYAGRGDDWSVSYPNAADWRDMNKTFTDIGYHQSSNLTLAGDGAQPERLQVERLSPNMFSILGAQPAVGRTWTLAEDVPLTDRVVVLSDALWRRRFGGDPRVVGTTINLSGTPFTVIGVMPPSFQFPGPQTEMYVPARATKENWPRSNGGMSVIGRLKPGVALADAQKDLDRVSKLLETSYPGTNKDLSAHITTLREVMT